MKEKIILLTIGALLVVVGVLVGNSEPEVQEPVSLGNQSAVGYSFATSTVSAAQPITTLKSRQGTLGRIVLATPATTGTYSCFNATTTNINLRESKYSTSTIELIAVATAPESTTLDIGRSFHVGLTCVESTGFDGVYTVLWD